MALTQKRVHVLTPYTIGDLPDSEITILVDNASFSESKNITLEDIRGTSLTEVRFRLAGPQIHNTGITFNPAFNGTPIADVRVFTIEEVSPGKWRDKDILWYRPASNSLSQSGDTIVIDSKYTDLSNIIITAVYKQA